MITYENLHTRICRPAVANAASLSSQPSLFDNILCGVTSLNKMFMLQKTSTETPDGVSVIAATGGGNWIQVKGRVFNNVVDQAAMIALPATEGDMAFRLDTTQAYVKNNGTSNTIADWTLLRTNSDQQVITVTGDTTLSSAQDGALIVATLTADSTITLPNNVTSFIDTGGFFNFINDSLFFLRFALQSPDTTPLFLPAIPPGGSVKISKTSTTGPISNWTPTFYSSYYRPQLTVSLPYTPDSTSIQNNIIITSITSGNPGVLTLGGPPPGALEGVGSGVKNATNKVVKIEMVSGQFINGQPQYYLMPDQEIYLAWDGTSNFRILNDFLDTSNLLKTVDLSGSVSVTLNDTHHGKIITVGASGNGLINLPQNSATYLPVGYAAELFNKGLPEFVFVPQGSDTVLNNQTLIQNNKCRIHKIAEDVTGLISTWRVEQLDFSATIPRRTISTPTGGVVDSSYNDLNWFLTGIASNVSLPVPGGLANGISDGFGFYLKNISGGNCFFIAQPGTTIENVTTRTIKDREGYMVYVNNGQWELVAAFIPPPGAQLTEMFFPAETNSAAPFGQFRTRALAFNAAFDFNFMVPQNFSSLVALEVAFCSPSGAFSGPPQPFDMISSYGVKGSEIDQFSTTDSIDLFPTQNKDIMFADISSMVPSIAANQLGGINIKQTCISGTTFYFVGLRLRYIAA